MNVVQRKKFYKKLLTLVLPIAFQQFMLAAVSASDAFILGYVNQDSLSAVSLSGQIQFIFSLFLASLTIGMSILVAQYWGKKDVNSVEKIFANVVKISFIISICFFLCAFFIPKYLMSIFTNENELISLGSQYLRVVSFSYLCIGFSQIYLCLMKNTGLVLKGTIISSFSVVLNICLNIIFIFGIGYIPSMGVIGAAIATVVSKFVELIWLIFESYKKDHLRLKMKFIFHNNPLLKKDFWKFALPVLGNELVWGCGFSMYSVIMGHLGSNAVAANSIANILKNLIVCFCIGIGNGGGIIVGNKLGKGEIEYAKQYGDLLCKIAVISGIISGIMLLCLSPIVLSFTNLNTEAQRYLKWMLVICSYYLIGKSINSTTIGGIFCAGGDSKFGFKCDAITMWLITVPLGLIAAFYFKLPVIIVYFIVNLDEIIKLPAVYLHYKKYTWLKNITRE